MKIKTKVLLTLMFTLVMVSSNSFAKEQEYVVDRNKSTVEFSFKSTLHTVHGKVNQFSGITVGDFDYSNVIESGKFIFDVKSMDTQEFKRDVNMRKMFNADKFSMITFNLTREVIVIDGKATLEGVLTIRDVSLPLIVLVDVNKKENTIVLTGNTSLSLKAFALKPPSVAMLIRVFDKVNVKFEVVLEERI